MKVAIVSSVFVPGLGYLEEGLTKVIAGMGHTVTVFASFHYPANSRFRNPQNLPAEQTVAINNSGFVYRIKRIRTLIKLRSNIIGLGLCRNISELNPDLIILVGVSDFFPLPLLNKKIAGRYNIYAFIGQNYDMWHWRKSHNRLKKTFSYVLNRYIKGFLFRKSIRHLSRIIFYTPDTEEIIMRLLREKLREILKKKMIKIPLGFNSNDFYFLPESRNSIRKRLNVDAHKIVFITVTRVDKSKKINDILNSLNLLRRDDIIYLIIGFLDNSYKAEVEQIIENGYLNGKVFCLPFLSNEGLNEYFSAADYGIWLKSGASIQQAMGTGLPVILPMNSTTSELITEGINGYYIKSDLYTTLNHALSNYSFSLNQRREIEAFNRNRFSYQSILSGIL